MADTLPSKSYARIDVDLDLPDLIEVQIESFKRLKSEGLADLFHEISRGKKRAAPQEGQPECAATLSTQTPFAE